VMAALKFGWMDGCRWPVTMMTGSLEAGAASLSFNAPASACFLFAIY